MGPSHYPYIQSQQILDFKPRAEEQIGFIKICFILCLSYNGEQCKPIIKMVYSTQNFMHQLLVPILIVLQKCITIITKFVYL